MEHKFVFILVGKQSSKVYIFLLNLIFRLEFPFFKIFHDNDKFLDILLVVQVPGILRNYEFNVWYIYIWRDSPNKLIIEIDLLIHCLV